MNESSFEIRYDIDSSEMSVETLIDSLDSFRKCFEEIKDYYDPSAEFDIKVKAPKEGSVLLMMTLLAVSQAGAYVPNLLNPEGIKLASSILSGFVNSIKLKSFLKGKPPKSEEAMENGQVIKVENHQGTVNIYKVDTMNVYNNTQAHDHLTNSFKALESNQNVNGLEIVDQENNEHYKIGLDEIKDLAQPLEFVDSDKKEVFKNDVHIAATKLDLEGRSKWSFIYDGRKMTASIKDESFYKRIDAGERFAKGDTLKVDLKINQEFDESANAFINKSYEVLRVLEHIPRPNQGRLKLED